MTSQPGITGASIDNRHLFNSKNSSFGSKATLGDIISQHATTEPSFQSEKHSLGDLLIGTSLLPRSLVPSSKNPMLKGHSTSMSLARVVNQV